MYFYDQENKAPNGSSIARNTELNSSVYSLGRTEGRQGEMVYYSRYESPDVSFDFATHTEHGQRQVEAILPNFRGGNPQTEEGRKKQWEQRLEHSKKQRALSRKLNIWHYEIVNVEHDMPLDVALAEDLLRLVWIGNSTLGEKADVNTTAGFLNQDPAAALGLDTPYLKMDQDGEFSVGVNGKW